MKLKKASKKWHRKALMIDPKKTILLLLESGDAKPKYVPPWVQKRELSPAVQEFFPLAWHGVDSLDSSVCADIPDLNEYSEPEQGVQHEHCQHGQTETFAPMVLSYPLCLRSNTVFPIVPVQHARAS